MDKKLQSIQDRATKALFMFEESRNNHIDVADVLAKTNEALRLVRELASALRVTSGPYREYQIGAALPSAKKNDDTPSIQ